jgi:DNA polymerase III subunit gamma/tau
MSLIAKRPRHWNEVVGQERVLRVLHAALLRQDYITRGFIFEGTKGVGKTSVAHLFARALMCTGKDPMGCSVCPSCVTFDGMVDNLEFSHPDFTQVDAAAVSGVGKARELLISSLQAASISRCKIILIDEAHRLSGEAWDAYLAPLEQADKRVMMLFVSSEARSIPATITSRCAKLRFSKLDENSLLGLLMSRADKEKIGYTLDGLRAIAHMAKGSARDAINYLTIAAITGKITPEEVREIINLDVEDTCNRIFQAILAEDLPAAAALADTASQYLIPALLIEELFSFYARQVFTGGSIAASFPRLSDLSAFFLKWTASPLIPSDVLPLMLYELSELRAGASPPQLRAARATSSIISETDEPVIQQRFAPISTAELKKRYGR